MYVYTVCTYVSPEVDGSLFVCTDVCMYKYVRMCLLKLMAVYMYPLLFGTGSAVHMCSVVWALYSAPTLVWWGMLYSVAHHCEQRLYRVLLCSLAQVVPVPCCTGVQF